MTTFSGRSRVLQRFHRDDKHHPQSAGSICKLSCFWWTFPIVLLLFLSLVSFWNQASQLGKLSSTNHSVLWHSSDYQDEEPQHQPGLGVVVLLAPMRNEGSMWGIDRFCLLLRAVRSVDQHLNSHYGPYPIIILLAKDYMERPRRKDAPYTTKDRALIRRWAPRSTIIFEEIELYSGSALEPNTTQELIVQWRQGWDGSVPGRELGYQSMCRLWSGRLQAMPFMQQYQYYMRLDDDSLLTDKFPFDPFQKMLDERLTYVYRREAYDHWGIEKLWEIAKPHLDFSRPLPFAFFREYEGAQPYNNFHISRTSFWTSSKWVSFWNDLNEQHAFFKYRVGDANVHAIAVMMMNKRTYQLWSDIPYVHNSNEMKFGWGTKAWKEECQQAYSKWLT